MSEPERYDWSVKLFESETGNHTNQDLTCHIGTVVRDLVLRYRRLMTAVTALDKQIERYRQMTGEQRLTVAFELHELSCDIAREAIRQANPEADATKVERLLHRRLELAHAE